MKSLPRAILTSCFCLSSTCWADFGVLANISGLENHGPSQTAFQPSESASLSILKRLTPRLSLIAGLSQTTDAIDQQQDNTSRFELSINSLDLNLGLRYQLNLNDQWHAGGQLGLLAYQSEVKLEEDFFGFKPSGNTVQNENGIGYFVALSVGTKFEDWLIEFEVSNKERLDYFKDSPKSFGFAQTAAGLNAIYFFD